MKDIAIILILMMSVLTSCEITVPDHDHPLLEHTHPNEQSDENKFDPYLELMDAILETWGEGYYGRIATIRGTVEGFEELFVGRRANTELYIILKTKEPNFEFWVDVTSIADRLPGPRDLYLKGSKSGLTQNWLPCPN